MALDGVFKGEAVNPRRPPAHPTKENTMKERNRFNATGLATGSILALIVAMAISVVFDLQPAEARAQTTAVHTASAHA
jgi:hypothetical protein